MAHQFKPCFGTLSQLAHSQWLCGVLVGGVAIRCSICQLQVTVYGVELLGWLSSNCEKAADVLAGHLGTCTYSDDSPHTASFGSLLRPVR